MNKRDNIFSIKPIWIIAIILLIFPALLIHLGSLTFIEDEAIRAIVALEMLDTGQYFVPSINGDFYYYKPPIYNWVIAFSYWLTGVANEWTSRLPNIIFLLLYVGLIYALTKEHLGKSWAFINSMMFLTCGRILFWDSFLALIDISYSLLTYLSIILIFRLRKKRYWQAACVYFLSGVGYLMKGFPSLVFIALSYGGFYLWKRKWKGFFHLSHLLGLVILSILIGGYYLIYYQYNDVQEALGPLLDQSLRRTVVSNGILDSILHLFTYPFENIFHFLPWSLLSLLLFNVEQVKKAFANEFIAFNAIMFLSNITVYWVSPGVYPRYIIMLIPIYFTFFVYLLKLHWEAETKWIIYLKFLFVSLSGLAGLGILYSVIESKVQAIDGYAIWCVLAGLVCILLAFVIWKKPKLMLPAMVVVLLVIRIWFNGVIIPTRINDDLGSVVRADAIRIASKYPNFAIYGNSRMDRTSSFYLASSAMKANKRTLEVDSRPLIYDSYTYPADSLRPLAVDSLKIREFNRMAYILK